jgi:hypothetical protein
MCTNSLEKSFFYPTSRVKTNGHVFPQSVNVLALGSGQDWGYSGDKEGMVYKQRHSNTAAKLAYSKAPDKTTE